MNSEKRISWILKIQIMDIRSLDLNLLPVFDALWRLGSVSAAARELDMSQPAFSAALSRLRARLADPLFVRTGRGMLPTPRAAALAPTVAGILDQVRTGLLAGGGFDPAQSRRPFTLGLSDVGAYVLWPRIVPAVRAQAPHLALRLLNLPAEAIGPALERGEIDLAIGAWPTLPGGLMQRRLYERSYVALVRTDHPLTRRPLDARALAEVGHLVVRQASGIQERLDEALARQGLRRSRVIEMPSYLMLPPLLEAGDDLAVLPGQLAEAFARHGRLQALTLPVELPTSVIRIHWHRRFHEDAGNGWLRGCIARHCGDPPDPATADGPATITG